MNMDKKEEQIRIHYKKMIETNLFDEYDIMGFLIFIRRHIEKDKFPNIIEFAHLIAHRKRDRGKVNDCIVNAIDNKYQTDSGSQRVKDYDGMRYEDWVKEWKEFGEIIDINFTDNVIKDLTVCVFSLSQFASFEDRNMKGAGLLELFVGEKGELSLVTTEGEPHSPYVCYSMCGNFKVCRNIPMGHLRNPVETIRVDGKLRLKDADGFLI